MRKNSLLVILFIGIFCLSAPSVFAADYYVATSGSDSNAGTQAQPFQTFAHAVSVLSGGDNLFINGGTYQEKLIVNRSGNSSNPITILPITGQHVIIDGQNGRDNLIDIPGAFVTVSSIEIRNSDGYCVSLTGQNITAAGLNVHHCRDHGIYTDGQHITIEKNNVYLTNIENQARDASSGWGSAIKTRVGADDVTIKNNTVYHNWGEGIATTRGSNIRIQDNTVYDNFGVNIYVDNSHDIVVERNFITCNNATTDSDGHTATDFYRSGHTATAIALGEEEYDGWGAQLARVMIKNNIAAFCYHSLQDYGPNVSGGGLDTVTVANNTFWGSSSSAISMESGTAKTRNSLIVNNIIQQPSNNLISAQSFSGVTYDYNFWMSGPPNASGAIGTHDKNGDVQFQATPNYDPTSFRLSASSQAISSANTGLGITDDFEKKDRFGTDSAADMGAIEFVGTAVGPSPSPQPSTSPQASAQPSSSLVASTQPLAMCTSVKMYTVNGSIGNPASWHLLTAAELSNLQPLQTIFITTNGTSPASTITMARIQMLVGNNAFNTFSLQHIATNKKPKINSTDPDEYFIVYTLPSVIPTPPHFRAVAEVYTPALDTNTDPWDDDKGWW